MPRFRSLLLCLSFCGLFDPHLLQAEEEKTLSRITFGSCAKQDKPQPIWDSIVKLNPEVFLFIGDNIYGDSEDLDVLKTKWDALGAKPGYQKLKQTCPVLAVWDDHDYGANDAGVEYPKKKESQKLFLDFFEEPLDSRRRKREGIYDAKIYGPTGKRVQIILLDTRYFRSPLKKDQAKAEPGEGIRGPYGKNEDPNATVLGEAQWKWLEEQLKQPAELRILASSIQLIPSEHHWEAWSRFPLEQQRMYDLIAETKANGVVVISGDRHHAEISRRVDQKIGYPIYDVTSSSLNQPQGGWFNEINEHRVGVLYAEVNFGSILIDWSEPDPTVRLQIRDLTGAVKLQQRMKLSELTP